MSEGAVRAEKKLRHRRGINVASPNACSFLNTALRHRHTFLMSRAKAPHPAHKSFFIRGLS